jgi:hypothetical protein
MVNIPRPRTTLVSYLLHVCLVTPWLDLCQLGKENAKITRGTQRKSQIRGVKRVKKLGNIFPSTNSCPLGHPDRIRLDRALQHLTHCPAENARDSKRHGH